MTEMHPAAPRDGLAIVINDLGGGGAQRVLVNLLKDWSVSGGAITLITYAGEDTDFYPVPAGVRRVVLGGDTESPTLIHALRNNMLRVWRLRRALKDSRARTVLSFIASTNVLTVMAARWLGLRVVVSERNDPARQSLGRAWDALRRWAYQRADLVTANSQGALRTLSAYVPEERLAYVPNPVVVPPPTEPLERRPVVLNVGRLHAQKAQDTLLRAFAEAAGTMPGWRLSVAGDGGLRESLKALADDLGIAERVDWLGRVTDPFPLYRSAGIFCLPSRHEGTPNALLEALACGLPAIVSDASPGPLDYVRDGESGLVVPCDDVAALATALRRLAGDADLAARLAEGGRAAVAGCAPHVAVAQWERLLWPQAGRL